MIRESFPMCVSSFTILMKFSVNATLRREDLDFSHCWKTFSISFLCQMCVYSFLLWHWFEWTPRQLCGRKTWQILKQLHLVYWPGESSYRLENVISVHPPLWTRGDQLLKDRWSLSQFLGDFTSFYLSLQSPSQWRHGVNRVQTLDVIRQRCDSIIHIWELPF